MTETIEARTGAMGYPIRRKSAHGQPRPGTSIERCCRTCRASFIGLAPGKTGEAGIWHDWHWYCSAECAPAECMPAAETDEGAARA